MAELKESLAWMPHVWTIMSKVHTNRKVRIDPFVIKFPFSFIVFYISIPHLAKFGIIRGNQAQIR